jgi:DNA-binding LytR/AlgR family response regulator
MAQLVEQMRALLPQAQSPERLTVVRAAVGNMVRMIPVQDVVYFQALDKYVNVATADSEALIRLPLKDLMAQLDPAQFCQVSRSSIVNMRQVASASRDEMGKLTLALHGRADRLKVSPLFAHLFRQM